MKSFFHTKRHLFLIAIIMLTACAFLVSAHAEAGGDPSSYIIMKGKTPQDLFNDGEHLASVGEYKQAYETYNYALSVAKDSKLKKQIKKAKHKIRHEIRDIKKAERAEMDKKYEETQKQIKSLTASAIKSYEKKDYDSSEADFKQVLELDPDNSKAKMYIDARIPARRKEAAARSEKKEACAEKKAAVVSASEKKAKARAEKEAAKKAAEARAMREKAIAKQVNFLNKNACKLYKEDDLDGATVQFKKVLDLDPDNKKAKKYLQKKIPARLKKIEAIK